MNAGRVSSVAQALAALLWEFFVTRNCALGGSYKTEPRWVTSHERQGAEFLEGFDRTQKFEFRQEESGSALTIDSKEEYSKNSMTQIARILHGSKCDVYVVFCR